MNVRTFIDRPILSGVISVLMVLVGIIGLTQLPLEQFPEIAPPTVRIMASYTGANAETVQKSVVVPLEEAINGVEGMMYMTSSVRGALCRAPAPAGLPGLHGHRPEGERRAGGLSVRGPRL